MATIGNIKDEDLFLKVVKTLDGNFRVMNFYKKNGRDYTHSVIGPDTYPTSEQAILAGEYQEGEEKGEVINSYT